MVPGMTSRPRDGSTKAAPVMRFDRHPRSFAGNFYVYAVLSRRARGISIGVNLNPDKVCNFGCIYCQVDRSLAPKTRRVDAIRLLAELEAILDAAAEGGPEGLVSLDAVPVSHRRLADLAFSGDGEPTSHPEWATWVEKIAALIEERSLVLPMTLITNASLFHRPRVKEGLDLLAERGGQVWAKLDAGSEEHYRQVAGSALPFRRILDNILEEACRRPLVIQSLFYRLRDEGPPRAEIEAWADRLAAIVAEGGSLAGVQVTTVSRKPPRPDVGSIDRNDLELIAETARARIPGVVVEVFPALSGRTAASASPEDAREHPRGETRE